MSESEIEPTSTEIALTGSVHDLLIQYQVEDESMTDTLHRLMHLVPHPVDLPGHINREDVGEDTRIVVSRWPDETGYVDTWTYSSPDELARQHPAGNRSISVSETVGDWFPTECVLCDYSADTHEQYEEHMDEAHNARL